MSRIASLALIALFVLACGGDSLTITSPIGGSHVSGPTVEVTGTAPANAEIVQDIPARPDQRTLSGADGKWRMTVDLDMGENVLTFRVGDNPISAEQILVIRDQ